VLSRAENQRRSMVRRLTRVRLAEVDEPQFVNRRHR
jgi:hypothetical protein